jgi:alpha-1,4-digalacturonate transport system substrate-binding protein
MKKIGLLMLISLLMTPALLIGQGASEAPVQKKDVIRFVWFTDGPDQPAIEALVEQYEEENVQTDVEFSIVPFGELNQLLITQASAGQAPDVARVTEPYRFFEFGLDLRPYTEPGFENLFLEGPIKLVTGPQGEIFGFPQDLTMNGPFVNVSLFKQAGVALPEGDVPWETWFELAKKVKDITGVPYAAAADRSGHRLAGIIQSYGGSYFTPDGKSLNLNSPETRGALQTFVELHDKGIMPLDIWAGGSGYVGGNQQFINGQLVMYISGNWQVAQFASTIGDSFEWKAVANGVNVQSGGMPGGKFLMAFDSGRNPEATGDFIQFLSSKESLAAYASEAMFLPARIDLLEEGVDYPVRSDVMNTFLADLSRLPATAYSDNYHLSFGPVGNVVRDRITQAITGELTFSRAMELMIREAGEVMQ